MNKKELAIELNKHWLDSVEKVKNENNEIQVFVVCSCGEWIPIPLEPIPEVGDPVFAFSEHCVDAMLKNTNWIDEEQLARALHTVDCVGEDCDKAALNGWGRPCERQAAAIVKAYPDA